MLNNRYVLSRGGIWVRDFVGQGPGPDINNLTSPEERVFLLGNRQKNLASFPVVPGVWKHTRDKVLVVSDGNGFEKCGDVLAALPKDVYVVGVNRAWAKWGAKWRRMDLFLANNPYEEAVQMARKKDDVKPPPCLFSTRTCPEFLKRYGGNLSRYEPACEENFAWKVDSGVLRLDDYRNPVCGAIHLASRMGALKIALLCCDDSFTRQRPTAVEARPGYWHYQSQATAQGVADAMFWWLRQGGRHDRGLADASRGQPFSNAENINHDDLPRFFSDE